jgi:hypothetical protein
MMKNSLVAFLLLWLCPACFGQSVRIRVIDAKTGLPLQKQSVSVVLVYRKGEKAPAKYDANLHIETDIKVLSPGACPRAFTDPGPAHFRILALWMFGSRFHRRPDSEGIGSGTRS